MANRTPVRRVCIELRRLWSKYFLLRPDNHQSWESRSRTNDAPVDGEAVENASKRHRHLEYGEAAHHQAETPQPARYRLATARRMTEDLAR